MASQLDVTITNRSPGARVTKMPPDTPGHDASPRVRQPLQRVLSLSAQGAGGVAAMVTFWSVLR